jgi:hypothetical protein
MLEGARASEKQEGKGKRGKGERLINSFTL